MATAAIVTEEIVERTEVFDLDACRARAAEAECLLFRSVFAPRTRMNLLEWGEQRRYLSPEANALAADAGGPVRYTSDLTPYHRDIMLALSDPQTEIVACKLPSQDGKTELLNNFVGYKIDLDPGPMLVLQPTKEMAEAWSKDRLAPMIRDTKELRGRVRDARSRDSENTILHKKFPGGHLTAVGSNSAAGLASRPIRDVLVDEVDRCAKSAGTEGDAIRLAFRRAVTFRRGKKLLISSPTIRGESRIDKEYQLGTREELHLPCPHCGEYQFLVWGGTEIDFGLKWEPGQPDTAYYVCEHNGCIIEEKEKAGMIARYRWIAQAPEKGPRRRSFWKNLLASNLVPWRKLVAEWIEVQGKPMELQVFINTVQCELFDPIEGEEVEVDSLLRRQGKGYPKDNDRDTGIVPAGVAILTRSVDVQGDRLETCVWGWGANETSWLIEHELIPGDPSTLEPWTKLDEIMKRRYLHASKIRLRPRVTFIDSGGHSTKQVYSYCRTRMRLGVFAIKGSSLEGHPLLGRPSRPDSAKTILYHIGSFTGKESLIRRLTKIPEVGAPGFIHLPAWLDSEQIAQFTREKLVSVIQKGGKRKRAWQLLGRNEMMDLYVYALAALQTLGPRILMNLGTIAKRLEASGAKREPDPAAPADGETPATAAEEPPPPEKADAEERPRKKKRRRSRWVDGWKD
jgi:phage terminase large subunit GpA-like protein